MSTKIGVRVATTLVALLVVVVVSADVDTHEPTQPGGELPEKLASSASGAQQSVAAALARLQISRPLARTKFGEF